MTSKDYFAKRNGGKTPQEMEDDNEFVGARWCQKLMSDFAKHKTAEPEQRLEAGQNETFVNCPEPFTAEFLTYLLVNALRNLNEAQKHNLALSLAVRDPLFSIEEYKKQLDN